MPVLGGAVGPAVDVLASAAAARALVGCRAKRTEPVRRRTGRSRAHKLGTPSPRMPSARVGHPLRDTRICASRPRTCVAWLGPAGPGARVVWLARSGGAACAKPPILV